MTLPSLSQLRFGFGLGLGFGLLTLLTSCSSAGLHTSEGLGGCQARDPRKVGKTSAHEGVWDTATSESHHNCTMYCHGRCISMIKRKQWCQESQRLERAKNESSQESRDSSVKEDHQLKPHCQGTHHHYLNSYTYIQGYASAKETRDQVRTFEAW